MTRAASLRPYRTEDAEVVVVALGSVLGSLADVVDELRDEGVAVGALGVTCYRPWPVDEVRRALRGVPRVIVLNRAVAVGVGQHPGPGRAPVCPALDDGPRRRPRAGGPTRHARRPASSWCSTSLPAGWAARRLTFYDLDEERAATELARELADASPRAETAR